MRDWKNKNDSVPAHLTHAKAGDVGAERLVVWDLEADTHVERCVEVNTIEGWVEQVEFSVDEDVEPTRVKRQGRFELRRLLPDE